MSAVAQEKLRELQRRALELVKRMSKDEEKLIREIAELSPNRVMYLGYVPIHLRGSSEL